MAPTWADPGSFFINVLPSLVVGGELSEVDCNHVACQCLWGDVDVEPAGETASGHGGRVEVVFVGRVLGNHEFVVIFEDSQILLVVVLKLFLFKNIFTFTNLAKFFRNSRQLCISYKNFTSLYKNHKFCKFVTMSNISYKILKTFLKIVGFMQFFGTF